MALRAKAWDTFTESADTALASHSAEIGGVAWSPQTSGGKTWTVKANVGYMENGGGGLATLAATDARVWNGSSWFSFNQSALNQGAAPTIRNIISGSTWNLYCYMAYCQFTTNVAEIYQIRLYRVNNGALTQLSTANKTAVTLPVKCRIQATGSSPTALSARFWSATGTEPTGWDTTASDNTAGNQTAATAPVGMYMEGGRLDEIQAVEGVPDPVVGLQSVKRAATW